MDGHITITINIIQETLGLLTPMNNSTVKCHTHSTIKKIIIVHKLYNVGQLGTVLQKSGLYERCVL